MTPTSTCWLQEPWEAEPNRFHNDLPSLCTPELDATAFIASNHGATSLSVIVRDATQGVSAPLQ